MKVPPCRGENNDAATDSTSCSGTSGQGGLRSFAWHGRHLDCPKPGLLWIMGNGVLWAPMESGQREQHGCSPCPCFDPKTKICFPPAFQHMLTCTHAQIHSKLSWQTQHLQSYFADIWPLIYNRMLPIQDSLRLNMKLKRIFSVVTTIRCIFNVFPSYMPLHMHIYFVPGDRIDQIIDLNQFSKYKSITKKILCSIVLVH